MSLHHQLVNCIFKGFENADIDKILMRLSISIECGICTTNIVRLYLHLIASLFLPKIDKYRFDISNQGHILFFQSYQDRPSSYGRVENVRSLVRSDYLRCISQKRELRFLSGFKLLVSYIPQWMQSLGRTNIPVEYKISVLCNLLELWYFKRELPVIEYNKYKLVVSYYDSISEDSFLLNQFARRNIKTATLQHGQFTAWRENVLENSGVEFRSSNSDYFLCWNKFTYDEAMKQGLEKNRLVVVGILSYVGKQVIQCHSPKNRVFGVVISHPMWEQENFELIQSANVLAKTYNLQYYLKLHPNYSEDYFERNVDRNFYRGNIVKGISMTDYANQVEFSIVGSSSVFVELVYIRHDVIRLSDHSITDKYKDVTIGKVFRSSNDICNVYEWEKDKDYTDELFDYLCSVKDTTDSYQKFLKQFE